MAGQERIDFLAGDQVSQRVVLQSLTPEITDAEFDALWDELKQLDPNNTVLHE